MTILNVFVLLIILSQVNASGHEFSLSCPINSVYAIAKQDNNVIGLDPTKPQICGETRTCIYSRAPACSAKGQYVSGVNESTNGNILCGCCQYTPPVQNHHGDDCHEIFLQTTDLSSTSSPRPPTPITGHIDNDKKVVVMEQKPFQSGSENQLIKSIKKIKTPSMEGYVVLVCQPQCGKSTTNQPSTEQPTTEPPPPPKKGFLRGADGKVHCFSADMTVRTPHGRKRMDEIRAGDEVLVASSNSKPTYEKIEWLYHSDPNVIAEFITITTKSRRILRLSPNHLIPFVPCSNVQIKNENLITLADTQSFFARKLKVGHCVAALIDKEFVADQIVDIVRETKTGIFSPITSQGTIVVNDLYVSCYSSLENQMIQKTVHSIIITMRRFVSKVSSIMGNEISADKDPNIPLLLQALLKVAQIVLPSNV